MEPGTVRVGRTTVPSLVPTPARMRTLVALLVLAALAAAPRAVAGTRAPALQELVGALHEHSGYSDGWAGSRPSTYFLAGRDAGLDFVGSGEHAESADYPGVFSEECLGTSLPECALADHEQPENSFRKWEATLEQALAASTDRFTAFRGFEWSSARFGHIGVYLSTHDASSLADGGAASLEGFWSWFTRAPSLGGGADGLAVFNHPSGKGLEEDPAFDWNDFAYVPEADERMVGLEVFNRRNEHGTAGPYPGGAYVRALDRGWHVGAVGAEDLGKRRSDGWGGAGWPKTVLLAQGRSVDALREALLARRFYAVREASLRLGFAVDGRPMGARLSPAAGRRLAIEATASDAALVLELVTSGGAVVARGEGGLRLKREARAGERFYFVRALRGSEPVAYSSPVWVEVRPRRGPAGGEWLAGDLHVHTCYSHDVYCGPGDEGTGPEEAYAFGLSVGGRFLEASLRGLDYLAISDHNDVRSSGDADFDTAGVIGVAGYEASLRGHAQLLGLRRLLDPGDRSAAAVGALADVARAEGGVFQANHPADRIESVFASCSDTAVLDWAYGYDVRPDTIEVWNPTSSTAFAEAYWECWLERGERIAATGGSDSHWAALSAVQGVGHPTTWVFAPERSERGILAALREGRTVTSRLPPGQGGALLLLEADADRDGVFEATVGDRVPPGTPMRVIADGLTLAGNVVVRANGRTVLDAVLAPGAELRFAAPEETGWVRARLSLAPATASEAPGCDPAGTPVATCAYDLAVTALTSPVYVTRKG